jgi:uncharacterized protein (TIGR00369 family)
MACTDKSEPGVTVWTMRADERFTNPAGVVQGGFLAAMCDSAMGASSITWAVGQGRRLKRTANAEMKVSFLRAVRPGEQLICTARVISGGRRVAFVEAEIQSGDEPVARASSTYLLSDA